jgi:hypothetical protein
VGALMASMVFQIEKQNQEKKEEHLKLLAEEIDVDPKVSTFFDDLFTKIQIEHTIIETSS